MINLIKSDLYRIFKGKAIYITLAIVIIIAIVSCVGMSSGYIGVSTGSKSTSFDKETTIALNEANNLIEYRNIIKRQSILFVYCYCCYFTVNRFF